MTSTPRDSGVGGDPFTTTQWTVVLTAGESDLPGAREAMATLYTKYARPLYAYARRHGRTVEEGQDLVQDFFAHLMEKKGLHSADPRQGRFRCFLQAAFRNFLANEWRRAQARKRGGGCRMLPLEAPPGASWTAGELADASTPDKAFEREWALTVLAHALARLRTEHAKAGQEQTFEVLKNYLPGAAEGPSYREAAVALHTTEGAVKTAVHRLRKRYRHVLRDEIAATLDCLEDVEAELRYLLSVLGS